MMEKQGNILPDTRPLALKLSLPILGLVGMGISGYLTFLHYRQMNVICLPSMNCDAVLDSQYSLIWGVPLSLLGLLLYTVITLLCFWQLSTGAKPNGFTALVLYTFSLAGVLFYAYLYYLETFEIQAFCIWCIGSSVVMLAIFILSIINLAQIGTPLRSMPRLILRWISQYVQW